MMMMKMMIAIFQLDLGGGRVERMCWVNFQCRGVLLLWMIVGQGPIAPAIGAGGGLFGHFFSHLSFLFSFSPGVLPALPWPRGSILTGDIPGQLDSDCPLCEELSGGTACLPWVATRKPDEGILEVEKLPRDLQMYSTRLFGLDFGVDGRLC